MTLEPLPAVAKICPYTQGIQGRVRPHLAHLRAHDLLALDSRAHPVTSEPLPSSAGTCPHTQESRAASSPTMVVQLLDGPGCSTVLNSVGRSTADAVALTVWFATSMGMDCRLVAAGSITCAQCWLRAARLDPLQCSLQALLQPSTRPWAAGWLLLLAG